MAVRCHGPATLACQLGRASSPGRGSSPVATEAAPVFSSNANLCPETSCCASLNGFHRCVAPTKLGLDNACGTEDQCAEALTCRSSQAGPPTCKQPVATTEACNPGAFCNPEHAYCDDEADQCVSALPLGARCSRSYECVSGHCARPIDQPVGDQVCHPTAQMFDSCADGIRCEPGTSCIGNVCRAQRVLGNPCDAHHECSTGFCRTVEDNVKVCAFGPVEPDSATSVAPFCYFALPEDLHDPAAP